MNYKRQKHESVPVYLDRIERLVNNNVQRQGIIIEEVLTELAELNSNMSPKYYLDKAGKVVPVENIKPLNEKKVIKQFVIYMLADIDKMRLVTTDNSTQGYYDSMVTILKKYIKDNMDSYLVTLGAEDEGENSKGAKETIEG